MSNIKEIMQVLRGMYTVYLQGNVFDILFFL